MDNTSDNFKCNKLQVSVGEGDSYKPQENRNQRNDEKTEQVHDELELACTVTSKELDLMDTNVVEAIEKENDIEQTSSDLAHLKLVVKKLDEISEKLGMKTFGDSSDEFGKYIASVLRSLPEEKVLALKENIVSDVLDVLLPEDKGLFSSCLPVGSHFKQLPDKAPRTPSIYRIVRTSARLSSQSFPLVPCQTLPSSSPAPAPTPTAAEQPSSIQEYSVASPASLQFSPNEREGNASVSVPTTSSTLLPKFPKSPTTRPTYTTTATGIGSGQKIPVISISDYTRPAEGLIGTNEAPEDITATRKRKRPRKRSRKGKQNPIRQTEVESETNIEERREIKRIKEDLRLLDAIISNDDNVAKEEDEVIDLCDESEEMSTSSGRSPRVFKCSRCSSRYSTQQELARHLKWRHSDSDSAPTVPRVPRRFSWL